MSSGVPVPLLPSSVPGPIWNHVALGGRASPVALGVPRGERCSVPKRGCRGLFLGLS